MLEDGTEACGDRRDSSGPADDCVWTPLEDGDRHPASFYDLRRAAHELEGFFLAAGRGHLSMDFGDIEATAESWTATARHDVDGPPNGYVLVFATSWMSAAEDTAADVGTRIAEEVAETVVGAVRCGGVVGILHPSGRHLVSVTGVSRHRNAARIRVIGERLKVPAAVMLGVDRSLKA